MRLRLLGAAAALLLAPGCVAQNSYFEHWPEGTAPEVVGRGVAVHFVGSPHQYSTGTLHYSEVITWYGALEFAERTHDTGLRDQLVTKFAPLMPGGSDAKRIPQRHHVDDSIFGIVPIEIGIATGDQSFVTYGKGWAERQWEGPRADGLSQESRFWIDDMYMLTILQLEAYRATKDSKYLDRDAVEMAAYLDKLQQPTGLFYHSVDVPIYWGRGDGWVAAGMAELLSALPEGHPQRARILKGYRSMMASLLRYQGKDGMWRQVLDREDAWPEASGTAMFTFAMIRGVKRGWLTPDVYGPAARRAWLALVGYVDQNEDVTNVCEGTNKLNDVTYYLARKRRTGDFHGQAPLLWAASELLTEGTSVAPLGGDRSGGQ